MPKLRFYYPWFDRRAFPVLAGIVAGLYLLEEVLVLREQQQSKVKRSVINTAVAASGFAVVRAALLPAMVWAGTLAERKRFGLVQWLPLPGPARYVLAFLLLDYTNYLWHVCTHRVPLLFRLHRVHHSDLDMDVTTGFRFHLGEQVFSILFRGGMIALIGAPPKLVLEYEAVFEGCTAFHHSNLRLPAGLEALLARMMITPRAHGIHHSIVEEEFNSNFGVVFPFWDMLHGTRRTDVAQEAVTIGMPAYRDADALTVGRLHKMPVEPIRPWALPDGTVPRRSPNGQLEMTRSGQSLSAGE
ncbi:sterol desaturase/sphingolipid hydroxylase (fatty acid hydroxylase superfamily) [Neolewinella xylanilytica]|uniref:Sterol desaturase/sphingolipid hydroxylase (Fatty acid hydroxylase superfamily) n=1 Tax=Neolewinella xylanilytica TaxID=1514080 RepID=A0A2S6I9T1_9BACT|nr:sterol desaturase family protein [Neolewinella xylanilytica]PPK88232.1 sterol desaturase/sphingolipid hydroxylase (fatty acid hydroxylase superfamily) [Neolewinella xylanilytica]